ncbi:MAG TPA: NUDIX hydrolase, partial [Actinomycetota bacterium]|nr:NUDIX hydrolase [Actinomycetota bacterium]
MRPSSSEEAFGGDFFRVEIERWDHDRTPREIVRAKGAAALVALTKAGEVVLVRQLRESVRRPVVELPEGVFDVEG